MKSKTQIIKYIDAQISNLRCAMIDDSLDDSMPHELKDSVIDGYKKRIKELEEICRRLEFLLT